MNQPGQNGEGGQTPLTREELMQRLESIENEGAAGEGQAGETPDFPNTDDGKKQRDHWYAEQRRLLKASRDRIKALEQAEATRNQQAQQQQQQAQQQQQSLPQDNRMQANLVLLQLQNEAMTNVGIPDAKHPLVQMEVNRLYVEKVQQNRSRQETMQRAPEVIESVLTQFPVLTDEDRAAVKQRIGQLDRALQGNEQAVKTVVHVYMGENIDKFAGRGAGGSQQAGAGAAAASGARTRGSGVPPANPPGGRQNEKPATPDETKGMRALGLDPLKTGDVTKYRVAVERKSHYSGQ